MGATNSAKSHNGIELMMVLGKVYLGLKLILNSLSLFMQQKDKRKSFEYRKVFYLSHLQIDPQLLLNASSSISTQLLNWLIV